MQQYFGIRSSNAFWCFAILTPLKALSQDSKHIEMSEVNKVPINTSHLNNSN